MYCNNCGSQIDDGAFYCPHCGSVINRINGASEDGDDNKLSVLEIVFSVLICIIPIVGIVMGIIDLNRNKKIVGSIEIIVGLLLIVGGVIVKTRS